MQIVKPYAFMMHPDQPPRMGEGPYPEHCQFTLSHGMAILYCIEYITRISHRSEDMISRDSYDRLLRSVVLQHGDLSVIEHAKVSVEMVADRGITHELVRHRIGSYTQESTRFVNYQKKYGEMKVVQPEFDNEEDRTDWVEAMEFAEKKYMAMVSRGCKPQLARSVFPTGLASKIIVTFNLRSWRHLFIMRTCKEAHPQMRQITVPLLEEFKSKIPILFEDIEPGRRQADAMRLLR